MKFRVSSPWLFSLRLYGMESTSLETGVAEWWADIGGLISRCSTICQTSQSCLPLSFIQVQHCLFYFTSRLQLCIWDYYGDNPMCAPCYPDSRRLWPSGNGRGFGSSYCQSAPPPGRTLSASAPFLENDIHSYFISRSSKKKDKKNHWKIAFIHLSCNLHRTTRAVVSR